MSSRKLIHRAAGRRVPLNRPQLLVRCLLAGLSLPGTAMAAGFEFGPGIKGSFDTTLTAAIAMRTGSPNCAFIGQDNGGCASTESVEVASRQPGEFSQSYDISRINQDNGNLNYGRGQVFSSGLRGLHELTLSHPSGWSGLVRANWIQDLSVDRTRRTPLSDSARDDAARDFRFLDAYVSKTFDAGNLPGRVRVGNQVINWGEALFIPGGIGATNGIDVTKLHSPGAQLKEIQIPAPMVSMSLGLGKGLAVEGYIQARWNKSRLDPAGTFFSTSDLIGRGAQGAYLPTSLANSIGAFYGSPPAPAGSTGDSGNDLATAAGNPLYGPLTGTGSVFPAGGDRNPSNGGQWGLALRKTDSDSGNEAAIYLLRYHDKLPNIGVSIDQSQGANPLAVGQMYNDYAENRLVMGASYNFRVADWSVGLEGSYRPRETVPIDPTIAINPANPYYCNGDLDPTHFLPSGSQCKGSVDREKIQLNASALQLLQPSGQLGGLLRMSGAAEGSLLVEVAVAHYPDLFTGALVPFAVTNDYRMPTRTSTGLVMQLTLAYPNWFDTGWLMTHDATLSYGVSGISASTLPGFVEGAGALGLGFTIDFHSKPGTKLRIDYSTNFGGGLSNPLRDRNWVGVSLATSF